MRRVILAAAAVAAGAWLAPVTPAAALGGCGYGLAPDEFGYCVPIAQPYCPPGLHPGPYGECVPNRRLVRQPVRRAPTPPPGVIVCGPGLVTGPDGKCY